MFEHAYCTPVLFEMMQPSTDLELQISRRVEQRYQEKLELLKRGFEDRLRQIADTLAAAGARVSSDATLAAMADDPESMRFMQVRAAEILQEEMSVERERIVATLMQQLTETRTENAELVRVNRELCARLAHHDSLVAGDIQREAAARVDAEKRSVAVEHELQMLRIEKQAVDEELVHARSRIALFAARDKAANDAERTVKQQAQQVRRDDQRRQNSIELLHRCASDFPPSGFLIDMI
jgi:hypothetical protein